MRRDLRSKLFSAIRRAGALTPQRLIRLMYTACLVYLRINFFGILALEIGLYEQIHRRAAAV